SGRADEAQALARLRARLEETLARHSGVDARVKVDRKALRVVSHGPAEPPPRAVAAATTKRVATSAASTAGRRPAAASTRRPAVEAGPRDWSYSGDTGPAHWASLNPAWAACAAEVPQSPIDIRDGIAVGL